MIIENMEFTGFYHHISDILLQHFLVEEAQELMEYVCV